MSLLLLLASEEYQKGPVNLVEPSLLHTSPIVGEPYSVEVGQWRGAVASIEREWQYIEALYATFDSTYITFDSTEHTFDSQPQTSLTFDSGEILFSSTLYSLDREA